MIGVGFLILLAHYHTTKRVNMRVKSHPQVCLQVYYSEPCLKFASESRRATKAEGRGARVLRVWRFYIRVILFILLACYYAVKRVNSSSNSQTCNKTLEMWHAGLGVWRFSHDERREDFRRPVGRGCWVRKIETEKS